MSNTGGGAYDELVAYLEDYEETTNKLSLTDLRLNGSRDNANLSDYHESAIRSTTKTTKSPGRASSRPLPPSGRGQQATTTTKRLPFTPQRPSSSHPPEQSQTRPSHFGTELEFFLQRLLKRKQMRLHQLRALQQSLFADLEWDMEFNEGVIDAHSLPKEALSEEEYQTMLFGSDMPADNDETNENQRMTNHGDGKSTTVMERIVHASAWNEFDEKIDFSRSFLQSKSKLRTIARSIGDVLSQSSDSVRTSRPPYDVSKLDLSHYIQQEELREQQERQRRRVSSRPSDWRPSHSSSNSSNCSSASSTPHRNATSSTTAHDHRSKDRARSGASASSSSSSPDRSMIPAPRDSHHHRFPVDISQPLAPEAMTTTRVESLASSPTSSPGQHHRSATISLYSIPDSPPPAAAPAPAAAAPAAIRRQSPSPTHRQDQAESPSRRPMDDPDSRANTTAHRPTAAVTGDTNSRRAEDELPPLGRKGSGGVSRSHSHDTADLAPLGGRTASSRVDAPLPVKPWGVAATAAAATAAAIVDDLDPWMLGISAIEARDSDSDYDAVMLFPAMKATRRPSSSSSDKPQRSDFDPVDSFLSTNRSSRSQSFDAHPPPRPPPTTDEGHVAFVDQRPPEAMDLFALASQDLDTLLGLANDGEEDLDNDEQPMRHGGPSLVSSLNSPPPMPKTPIGKPPFSPF